MRALCAVQMVGYGGVKCKSDLWHKVWSTLLHILSKNAHRKLHSVYFCLYVLFRLNPVISSSSQALIILTWCLVNTILLLSRLDLCVQ